MNKNKELARNTLIIFIGRFCTQFVSFLLIPIYTYYLSTSDYGYVDLVQTYIALLAPIIILRIDTAVFRFLIDFRDNERKKTEIISSSAYLLFFQIIILVIIFEIINLFLKFNYSFGIIINIVFISISSYLLQLSRGVGNTTDYSIASIISATLTIVLNIWMIVYFKQSAVSILYASAVANISCIIYLLLKNKIYKKIKIKSFNSEHLKKMLHYSMPMIPDGLSWWILNVSDRTIISIIIGASANGIYAVSSKFSNILSSIYQVFNMSWQESASLHVNDDDSNVFFSEVLNKTYSIFFSISILILVCMPLLFEFFIGRKYITAYYYIPILLFGNLFNAFANITGGVYIAKKETKKVARTTMLAATINIIINIFLIKKIGLYAAAISTLISYIVVAFYRYYDVKKYVDMRLNKKLFIATIVIYIVCTATYYVNNLLLNIIIFMITIIIEIYLNKNYCLILINKIRRKK